jgi:signal transduction histidine kinase
MIACELHDEIGQRLTSLKLLLELVAQQPASPTEQLTQAQTIVNNLVAQVRALSLALRPPMLDDLGLLPTLRWYFRHYTEQTGVQVIFKHRGLEQRFRTDVESAAYRIIQEALTNVARHAGVQEATVRIWANRSSLGVQIADEGRGFDAPPVLAGYETVGLSGMRERVLLLNGTWALDTDPGAGCMITVELPLATCQEEEASGDNESETTYANPHPD